MAQLSDFERYVLPFVAGAPAPAVEDAVLDACIEFCTRARVLRQILSPVTLVPKVAEYELDPPDGDNRITEVMAAWLPQGKIDPLTRPVLDELYPAGWANLSTADVRDVRGYYCRAPGIIRLVPMLSIKVARALTLEVAYAPARTATEVDDLLFDQYAEQIAAGALARLHEHPDADYADPSRVSSYRTKFEQAITGHSDDTQHGHAHHPLRSGMDDFR